MVSFLDVTGIKPCPDPSPNQNALRIASGTEPTLIRKEDTTPLISCPVFVPLCTTVNGGVGGQLSTGGSVQDGGRISPVYEGVWPQMIFWPSSAVVVLEWPPPTFLTAVPVVWNAFQARELTLVDSELCSYTGDCTPLLQLSDHSSTCEVVQNYIGRLECGRTQLEVSKELGIAQSVISRLWQRFQDDGNVSRCYSTGHPCQKKPTEHSIIPSRQLSSATGMTVSRQTVYRRLEHIGLYARRPVRCVPLTATDCRLRLTWSREHAFWTPQQWSCVMFSDESRFSLQSDSRRTLIWIAPGTRYHHEITIERHRYGGAGWLVWGGIILGSRTDLHVHSVTMTGHIYRDVILEQHVRLLRGAMRAEFLFMDDNTRPHRANIVDECFQSEDINRMNLPAYSPDLYPIEHVWDMLGRRIAALQPHPTCLPDLRWALLDEWCNIPQDQIDNLILTMPMRCKACIASSGKHTPY
ncbi:transposable element Tcb1 transposase [Trichonephila clavipes]|nr:transposable element Tcb1 transposase [Trichonephila clavipes]